MNDRKTPLALKGAKRTLLSLALAGTLLSPHPLAAASQAPVALGSASRFAVLAASEITSVPTSPIQGDVGLSPAARSNIAGLTKAEVTGSIFAADDGGAVAAMLTQAKGDLDAAYIDASPAGRPGGVDVSTLGGGAGELGGRTLAPGLYKSAPGSYALTSLDLTLDAGGDTNAVWIFQMAATLKVLPNRQVILAGGAQAGNVFWQVGTSATLSTYSAFEGTIMADQSIALQTGATLHGRALARIGAVTLQANAITLASLPEAPRFGPISRAPNGFVTLVITTTPGMDLTLQTSSNLTTWTTLATPKPAVSPYTFIDTTSSASTRRFYRAFYP